MTRRRDPADDPAPEPTDPPTARARPRPPMHLSGRGRGRSRLWSRRGPSREITLTRSGLELLTALGSVRASHARCAAALGVSASVWRRLRQTPEVEAAYQRGHADLERRVTDALIERALNPDEPAGPLLELARRVLGPVDSAPAVSVTVATGGAPPVLVLPGLTHTIEPGAAAQIDTAAARLRGELQPSAPDADPDDDGPRRPTFVLY